jgi:predicted ATPase
VAVLEARRSEFAEAEGCFHQSIKIARQQRAKSWELRAGMSLARLYQNHNKHAEAHGLLEPIYNKFTEGFDTADLREAKTLLNELSKALT